MPAAAATPAIPAGRRRGFLRAAAVGGLLLLAAAFLAGILAQRHWGQSEPPAFQRLTFRRGMIHSAQFAPDGQTIVYSASWDGRSFELFTTRVDSPESRPLGLPPAYLQAISPRGEMLVSLLQDWDGTPVGRHTLARVPLAGGAPRPLLEAFRSRWVDWAPDGENLALLQVDDGKARIEYPRGKVIWRSDNDAWDLRVAPAGDALAFCQSPWGDPKVVILDRAGKVLAQTSGWGRPPIVSGGESPRGCIAWAPGGQEVWFAASRPAGLYALTRDGKVRSLLRVPGAELLLLDVARDGRALVALVNVRSSLMVQAPGEREERDLSWFANSFDPFLSADGRWLLFTEGGEDGGERASVYFRGTDGSPAVRLGDGRALAISPDARWALTCSKTDPGRLSLLPTGAGEPRALPPLPMAVSRAQWLPGGKQLLINGTERGKVLRVYAMDIGAKTARPLTPAEAAARVSATSPDGSRVATWSYTDGVKIYSLTGGKPRGIPGVRLRGEEPIQWRADGRALYLGRRFLDGRYSIDEVDLATGRRVRWKELRVPDAGAGIGSVRMTPDGKAYAYNSWSELSTLYLVKGLR